MKGGAGKYLDCFSWTRKPSTTSTYYGGFTADGAVFAEQPTISIFVRRQGHEVQMVLSIWYAAADYSRLHIICSPYNQGGSGNASLGAQHNTLGPGQSTKDPLGGHDDVSGLGTLGLAARFSTTSLVWRTISRLSTATLTPNPCSNPAARNTPCSYYKAQ